MVKRTLAKILNLLPGEHLKRSCRRFYFNYVEKPGPPFPRRYNGRYFEYKLKRGITLKSYQDIAGLLEVPVQGYLEKHRITKGEVVVDCGAHFGAFTLYAARAVGEKGTVVAFEPDSLNFEKLVSNIELNRLTNVIALKKGVYSKNASLAFESSHDDAAHFLADGGLDSRPGTCLPVVTLDSELGALGIRRVDFIKMDVEGAEIEAVKGAARTLASNDVSLAIASYHEVEGKPTALALEGWFASQGYNALTQFPAHPTTFASKSGKAGLKVKLPVNRQRNCRPRPDASR
jgi:FkbM family methyltransferase